MYSSVSDETSRSAADADVRRSKVQRYLEKRGKRLIARREGPLYPQRSTFAQSRPRVGGRFTAMAAQNPPKNIRKLSASVAPHPPQSPLRLEDGVAASASQSQSRRDRDGPRPRSPARARKPSKNLLLRVLSANTDSEENSEEYHDSDGKRKRKCTRLRRLKSQRRESTLDILVGAAQLSSGLGEYAPSAWENAPMKHPASQWENAPMKHQPSQWAMYDAAAPVRVADPPPDATVPTHSALPAERTRTTAAADVALWSCALPPRKRADVTPATAAHMFATGAESKVDAVHSERVLVSDKSGARCTCADAEQCDHELMSGDSKSVRLQPLLLPDRAHTAKNGGESVPVAQLLSQSAVHSASIHTPLFPAPTPRALVLSEMHTHIVVPGDSDSYSSIEHAAQAEYKAPPVAQRTLARTPATNTNASAAPQSAPVEQPFWFQEGDCVQESLQSERVVFVL